MTITVRAAAKVNLALAVEGRRADGYHLLRTVMQSVGLYDTVQVTLEPGEGVTLDCDDPSVPTDDRNTAVRAAQFFQRQYGCRNRIALRLDKQIPLEAGLGGASADAAAVLFALEKLYGAAPTPSERLELAVRIGADVPFCLTGGTQLATGIGETLTALPPLTAWFVLVKPPFGIGTAEAFSRFDALEKPPEASVEALLRALADGDLLAAGRAMNNALEAAAPSDRIDECKQALLSKGALGACMTGSGSAVCGLFADRFAALHAAEGLRRFGRYSCVPAVPAGLAEA